MLDPRETVATDQSRQDSVVLRRFFFGESKQRPEKATAVLAGIDFGTFVTVQFRSIVAFDGCAETLASEALAFALTVRYRDVKGNPPSALPPAEDAVDHAALVLCNTEGPSLGVTEGVMSEAMVLVEDLLADYESTYDARVAVGCAAPRAPINRT